MNKAAPDNDEQTAGGPKRFRFDDWQFDADLNSLYRAGQRYRIPLKQSHLLRLLLSRVGQMVTRDDILSEIWGFKPVTDDVLSRNISALRKTLGDDRSSPRYIETIPKMGYRFIAELESSGPVTESEGRGWSRTIFLLLPTVVILAAIAFLFWPGISPGPGHRFDLARPLTGLSNNEQQPWYSKDQLSYVVLDQGTEREVWVYDIHQQTQHRVYRSDGFLASPIIAGDGRVLLMESRDDDCRLLRLQPDSGEIEQLTSCWSSFRSRMRADSQGGLLINLQRNDVVGIMHIAADGSQTELTHPDIAGHIDMAAVRMMGSDEVLLIRGDQIINELYRYNPEDLSFTQLTADNQYIDGFCQLDERTVIYASDRSGIQSLWQLDLHNREVISLGQIGARRPTCHPEHGIVYELTVYEANIWKVPLAAGVERQLLVQSDRYDNHPTPSPDRSQLMFISNRTGDAALWSTTMSGEDPQIRYHVDGGRVTRPRWSPDGSLMAVVVYEEDGSSIELLDASFNVVGRFPDLDVHVLNPIISADGWLYYLIDEAEGRALMRVPIDTLAQPELLLRVQISRFELMNDGRILFVRSDQNGFHLYNPITRSVRSLLPGFRLTDWARWTLAYTGEDAEATLFHACDDRICATAIDSGEKTTLEIDAPNAIGLSMAYDAEQDALLIAYTDRVSSQLMHMQLIPDN